MFWGLKIFQFYSTIIMYEHVFKKSNKFSFTDILFFRYRGGVFTSLSGHHFTIFGRKKQIPMNYIF